MTFLPVKRAQTCECLPDGALKIEQCITKGQAIVENELALATLESGQ